MAEETKKEKTTPEEVATTTPTTPPTPPTKTSEEEIEALKKLVGDLSKKLEAVSDKGRLSQFDANNKGPKKKLVSVSTFDGKVITSWSKLNTNKVYKTGDKLWREDQSTTLTFLDKTTMLTDYATWQRDKIMVECTVEKEEMFADGDRMFTVFNPEYGEFSINVKFVN